MVLIKLIQKLLLIQINMRKSKIIIVFHKFVDC